MDVINQKIKPRYKAVIWQKASVGFLALSVVVNISMTARIANLEARRQADAAQYQEQIETADHIRGLAVQELGAMALQQAEEQEARAAQTAAYEALAGYQYIGECTITAYCPCEKCCGKWADGLTATGIPAGPGIAAVDPSVIPLGSMITIDGKQYLVADTGVTGLWIDVCFEDHASAEAFGVQYADVWVVGP